MDNFMSFFFQENRIGNVSFRQLKRANLKKARCYL